MKILACWVATPLPQVPSAIPALHPVFAMLPPLPDNVPSLASCRTALARRRLPLTALEELVLLAGDVSVMGSKAVARHAFSCRCFLFIINGLTNVLHFTFYTSMCWQVYVEQGVFWGGGGLFTFFDHAC